MFINEQICKHHWLMQLLERQWLLNLFEEKHKIDRPVKKTKMKLKIYLIKKLIIHQLFDSSRVLCHLEWLTNRPVSFVLFVKRFKQHQTLKLVFVFRFIILVFSLSWIWISCILYIFVGVQEPEVWLQVTAISGSTRT